MIRFTCKYNHLGKSKEYEVEDKFTGCGKADNWVAFIESASF